MKQCLTRNNSPKEKKGYFFSSLISHMEKNCPRESLFFQSVFQILPPEKTFRRKRNVFFSPLSFTHEGKKKNHLNKQNVTSNKLRSNLWNWVNVLVLLVKINSRKEKKFFKEKIKQLKFFPLNEKKNLKNVFFGFKRFKINK